MRDIIIDLELYFYFEETMEETSDKIDSVTIYNRYRKIRLIFSYNKGTSMAFYQQKIIRQ